MDTGKFVGLLVFFLVGALVLVAFVPVIQETTSATDTFENDGLVKMDKITVTDTVSASWDYTNPYVFTVNGVDVDLPQTLPFYNLTVAGSDNEFMIRYIPNDTTYGTYLTVFSNEYANVSAGTVAETNLTLSIENGSITVSNGTSTNTNTFTDELFIVSNDGEYLMKNVNTSVYVLDDSEIFGVGRSWIPGLAQNINFVINGNIKNGFTIDYFGTNLDIAISDVEVTKTKINGYVNLYSFEKITFKITVSGNDYTVAYSQIVTPDSVDAEKSIHPDTTLATVINLLPLIAGVGLLMFLVGEFLYTRYL